MGTFTSKGTFEMLFSVCMSKLKQYDRKTRESTVFSLNFSSAGKRPFMDGKAKNIYFSKRGGGGQWSERHGPALTGKFFIPIF